MADSLAFRGFKHTRFAQQNSFRNILPRNEIRRQDRLAGRYPTIARSGDASRRGNNSIFFDDTNTIVFRNNVDVSFPTTFETGNQFLENDITSSIVVTSNITKFGVEQFVRISPHTESLRAFNDSDLVIQDIKTSQFYITGSGISDVGTGFTSNLGSKTIIKIPLQITSQSVFRSSSNDEIFYYNWSLQRFEKRVFNITPVMYLAPGHDRPFGSYFGATFTASPLFNAFGVPQSDFYANNAGAYAFTVWDASAGTEHDQPGSTILTSASNAATSSQLLDVSQYLHAPFLLEKAYLELPFSASEGWYNAPTAHSMLDGNVQLTSTQAAVGGPCVTFALLNQTAVNHREIILSGTIVPERDCTPWFELHQVGGGYGIGNTLRTLNGFSAYATPGFRVPSADFNGNAKLFMHAAQSHGTVNEYSPKAYVGGGFVSSYPWGRGQNGIAGRSLFGGEFVIPSSSNALPHAMWYLPSGTNVSGNVYLYNKVQNKYSPYLINPKDKLIAYLSVCHPAMKNDLNEETGVPTAWEVSSSYDGAGIPEGVGMLTLFGSFIKEGSEFHDTLNQRLETNEIHEVIGNDPVLDQFDVVSGFELSGSSVDRFSVERSVQYLTYGFSTKITSSFETQRIFSSYSDDQRSRWSTQYQWSSSSLVSTLKKSPKNIVLLGDETFWDTRIVNPSQIIRFYNTGTIQIAAGDVGLGEAVDITGISGKKILYTGPTSTYFNGQSSLFDWIMTFPFEPKFRNIPTTFANILRGEFFNVRNPGSSLITYEYLYPDVYSLEYGEVSPIIERKVAGENDSPGGGMTLGVGLPEFIKFFYGFGDGHGTYDNGHVKFEHLEPGGSGLRTRAALRGWRYGLMSGFPMKSTAVWRRDRFGQPRDMLEQRQDTKFYAESTLLDRRSGVFSSPISVKFVDSSGAITLPEYTNSSNLSHEATSSLPYFDGDVRNRENPMLTSKTNQGILVI